MRRQQRTRLSQNKYEYEDHDDLVNQSDEPEDQQVNDKDIVEFDNAKCLVNCSGDQWGVEGVKVCLVLQIYIRIDDSCVITQTYH